MIGGGGVKGGPSIGKPPRHFEGGVIKCDFYDDNETGKRKDSSPMYSVAIQFGQRCHPNEFAWNSMLF
jgi:hypothetical protein